MHRRQQEGKKTKKINSVEYNPNVNVSALKSYLQGVSAACYQCCLLPVSPNEQIYIHHRFDSVASRARICKRLWIPGIDSEESI